jgi:hypothetical protein
VAHRAISLLRPPQPAPTFAEGRRQDAGHKVQLVQRCIVVFAMGLVLYLIFLVQF